MASLSVARILTCLSCLLPFVASTLQAGITFPTNVIDSCWRGNPDWAANRHALADCSVGFGADTVGGRHGKIYTVTSTADNPANPQPGTLRYGATRGEPLWIVFASDMVITLKSELRVSSHKSIDGRGARVEIAHGACLWLERVRHVIVHGISILDCTKGDAISLSHASHVWIDHCSLARSSDGLVDVARASTNVTISNNYFSHHRKVMLLGNNDRYSADKAMKVTVVLNRFGANLGSRMPRVRLGYAHVANNRYDKWNVYAIGGSANSTIRSEGNYFVAPSNDTTKEVTRRLGHADWKNWTWRSSQDFFQNGAFFVESGSGSAYPLYTPRQAFTVLGGSWVPTLTSDIGPLPCVIGKAC